MAASQRRKVWFRARGCCEYCQLPESLTATPHEIDHIRSQKHRGRSTSPNLCLACFNCNSFKGSNVAGYDPDSGKLQPLFNPRTQTWSDHFAWRGPILRGKTPIGRTTIEVLRINLPLRVKHRQRLIRMGLFPPDLDNLP
jgi:hypothetical protein